MKMEYRNKYDVIVLGGGFAGCAAALAAAREGCEVLLIEGAGALGGAAVNSLILPFMPWWTSFEKDGVRERMPLSRGIFTEICDRLTAAGALRAGTFHEEYLKIILDNMMKEAGVSVLFHAVLCGVNKTGEKIDSIDVIAKSGRLSFFADEFADCTGDADLAVMSGCPCHLGRAEDSLCQPMTLCFRAANVDKELFFTKESRAKMQEIFARAKAEGRTSNPRENVLVFNTLIDGVVHFNTTRIVKLNPVDPFDVSAAEAEGRKQMLELFVMLKDELEAFKNADLLMSGAWIGARESRMIDGEHILTREELVACTRFEDAIAACNYDIDIHNPEGEGTSHYYFPDGEYYTIPFRSLLPKGADNLIVAGRCISSTHEAQASYRIMPTVCTLGEAAGVGAAVAFRDKCAFRDADVKKIQSILTANGAFIG